MTRHAIGIILLLSLSGLVLCGFMACMDMLAHYSLLAVSSPAPIVLVGALLLAVAIVLSLDLALMLGVPAIRRDSRAPNTPHLHPLELAFADGILNTKRY